MSHPDNVLHFALRDIAKQKPARIPVSGANATDIARIRDRIELVSDMFASIVKENLDILNCNLPVTRTIDTQEFLDRISDLRADMLGALANGLVE